MLSCFFCHLTGNAFYCRNDGVLVIVEGTSCIGHVILMVTDVTDTRPVGINDEIVDVGNGRTNDAGVKRLCKCRDNQNSSEDKDGA